jgi:hypothetical protein
MQHCHYPNNCQLLITYIDIKITALLVWHTKDRQPWRRRQQAPSSLTCSKCQVFRNTTSCGLVLVLEQRERQMSAGRPASHFLCWRVKNIVVISALNTGHFVAPKHWQLPVSFPRKAQPQLFASPSVAWSSPHEPSVSLYIMTRSHYSISCSSQQAAFLLGDVHGGTLEHSKLYVYVRSQSRWHTWT